MARKQAGIDDFLRGIADRLRDAGNANKALSKPRPASAGGTKSASRANPARLYHGVGQSSRTRHAGRMKRRRSY